jgi:ATP-dependent protease ClpP protease subunit
MMWKAVGVKESKKRKHRNDEEEEGEEWNDDGTEAIVFHEPRFFNDDITQHSAFMLAKELRRVAHMLKLRAVNLGIPIQPIYLHVTTNGGEINAAFSVVDCIGSLGVRVYSVVDGFVASAGTLITLAAQKRFIEPNAYMLVHQLSSGVWGKMSSIEEQVSNLNKLSEHLKTFYLSRTKLSKKTLKHLFLTDITWNAQESVSKGLADALYTPRDV